MVNLNRATLGAAAGVLLVLGGAVSADAERGILGKPATQGGESDRSSPKKSK